MLSCFGQSVTGWSEYGSDQITHRQPTVNAGLPPAWTPGSPALTVGWRWVIWSLLYSLQPVADWPKHESIRRR